MVEIKQGAVYMKRVLIALFVTLVLFIATGGLNKFTVTEVVDLQEDGQVYNQEVIAEPDLQSTENL
jgi:hypothetical protein